jgi:hypothetical protein
MTNDVAVPRSDASAVLIAVTGVLLAVRLFAAGRVGFADSEALYAAYALHPQPAYLDHPGLVGLFARAIGAGSAPSPERAHLVTTVLAAALPWEMALACRACGAAWPRAFAAALVVALVPEIAIGLFAMTPDLIMSIAWVGAIAAAAVGLRSSAGGFRSGAAFAAAGLLAGVAAGSKVSGLLLMVALAATYASRTSRAYGRTTAPWAGLAIGAIVLVPIIAFEARSGWPMLRHRLVDTQHAAGLSLRNAGALVGGQLAYLSPLVAGLAVLAAREAWRDRADTVGRLLLLTALVPAVVLVPLCLWSAVAEAHWLAPALLSLVPAAARSSRGPSRRALTWSLVVAGLMVAAVYAWVLVPGVVRLAPASYDPRLDLANELYGWPRVVEAVREEVTAETTPLTRFGEVAVVGPHWVICAQLEAGLYRRGANVPIGCETPTGDDYADWWPRRRWLAADSIVWVSDARFDVSPDFGPFRVDRARHINVMRDGREARRFVILVLTRRAQS